MCTCVKWWLPCVMCKVLSAQCTCCKTDPCVTKHYQLEYRCWLPCVMLCTTAIWHHSHNLQFVGTCLLLLGTESMLIMAIKYSMGRRVVLWSFVGVLWGTDLFFGLQNLSSASMLWMCLFTAFSWVREVIRLTRPTWQYYAPSNITAVHPKASHADSCNTTPLKRGSCTKYTQRLPSCKILSFIVACLTLYTVQIMPLMRKHYSSGSSIHVVATHPG